MFVHTSQILDCIGLSLLKRFFTETCSEPCEPDFEVNPAGELRCKRIAAITDTLKNHIK